MLTNFSWKVYIFPETFPLFATLPTLLDRKGLITTLSSSSPPLLPSPPPLPQSQSSLLRQIHDDPINAVSLHNSGHSLPHTSPPSSHSGAWPQRQVRECNCVNNNRKKTNKLWKERKKIWMQMPSHFLTRRGRLPLPSVMNSTESDGEGRESRKCRLLTRHFPCPAPPAWCSCSSPTSPDYRTHTLHLLVPDPKLSYPYDSFILICCWNY